MTAPDRLQIANWAVVTLSARVRANGTYSLWESAAPGHWVLETSDFSIWLTEGILLRPIDQATSCVLDVWSVPSSQKLLSVSWMPERPWEPPRLTKAKDDGWLKVLGWPAP